MSQLGLDFEARVRSALEECHRLGYHPSYFERMLADAGATIVAEKLVLSGDIQSGFKRLAQMGRLDLSIEFIMLEPQFEPLFKKSVIEAARWRRSQVMGETK